jgi:hypothetical protein
MGDRAFPAEFSLLCKHCVHARGYRFEEGLRVSHTVPYMCDSFTFWKIPSSLALRPPFSWVQGRYFSLADQAW